MFHKLKISAKIQIYLIKQRKKDNDDKNDKDEIGKPIYTKQNFKNFLYTKTKSTWTTKNCSKVVST